MGAGARPAVRREDLAAAYAVETMSGGTARGAAGSTGEARTDAERVVANATLGVG